MPTAPVVPGRNDVPEGIDLYSRSRAGELSGQNPEFAYQYVSKDPKHPMYVGRYLNKRELGNAVAGYMVAPAWEVARHGDGVQQGAKRADDTKGVDSTITHGDMILIRCPKAQAEKEAWMVNRISEITSTELAQNERKQIDETRYGVQVQMGNGETGFPARPNSSQLTGGK